MTTTRIAPGIYRTTTGHTIQVAEDYDGRRSGWHLIGPDGEWWQTYATKRDALEALADEVTR